jgi:hypothetical protein
MTVNSNSAPVQRSEEFLPKLEFRKERPKTARTIGSVVLSDLVETTFSIANEYVRLNKNLISYDVLGGGPRILLVNKPTGDYTRINVYRDADIASAILMSMDRGTYTRYGNRCIDEYGLSDNGLGVHSGGYTTDLIEKDINTGELSFGKGVGAAMPALKIVSNRGNVARC